MNKPSAKKNLCLLILGMILLVSIPALAAADFKNVIMLIPDGCGVAHTTVTRWYKGAPLHIDRLNVGMMRNYNSNSILTDSAPAATSYACGIKTADRFISVLPNSTTIPGVPAVPAESYYKPVPTLLEVAKLQGKSVGMASISMVQHATPAAFSAHTYTRSDYTTIAVQQVYQDMDVMLGGGRENLLPAKEGGVRKDSVNYVNVLKTLGYQIVSTRDELLKVKKPRIWGLFAMNEMAHDFDRELIKPDEPSLAEMTEKALELLSSNEKGFFLMVEASKIDDAAHANDPVGVVSDYLAFDKAVGKALDFAEKDGQTLVVVVADHDTGGMSLGSTKATSTNMSVGALVDPLKKAVLTGEGLEAMLSGTRTPNVVREKVAKYYGISNLTDAEVDAIIKAKAAAMNSTVGPMMSTRSVIGWTTGSHTGMDLPVYFYGLTRPLKTMENTDVALICAQAMGFKLDDFDARLYSPADRLFGPRGANVYLDKKDAANPILVVTLGRKTAYLPINTNRLLVRIQYDNQTLQDETQLEGLVIQAAPTDRVYLPQEVLQLFIHAGTWLD